jgi:hypothetical protein
MTDIETAIKKVEKIAREDLAQCEREAIKEGESTEPCIVFDLAFGIASDMMKYGDWTEVPKSKLGEEFGDWWENFTQYDDYANTILPELRRAVGCLDTMGVGTYTECTEDQLSELDDLVMELEGKIYEYLEEMLNQV